MHAEREKESLFVVVIIRLCIGVHHLQNLHCIE